MLQTHPLLNGKPLAPAARQEVFSGVDVPILEGVLKLRVLYGERKREVDALFPIDLVLAHVIDNLNALLVLGKNDLRLDLRSVHARAFQPGHVRERQVCYGVNFPAGRPVRRQLGKWRDDAVVDEAVRPLVGSRDVHILVETVGTGAIHQLAFQFLVKDAANCPARCIQLHPIVTILKDGSPRRGRRRRFRFCRT